MCISGAGAVNYKRWLPNTNFENPDNWNNGRLPCRYDRVLFPEEAPPVFLQINATLVEIVRIVTVFMWRFTHVCRLCNLWTLCIEIVCVEIVLVETTHRRFTVRD